MQGMCLSLRVISCVCVQSSVGAGYVYLSASKHASVYLYISIHIWVRAWGLLGLYRSVACGFVVLGCMCL